jgi:hypothetical protein
LAGDAVGRLVRGVTSTRALSGFDQPVLDVLDVPRLLDEGLAAADLLERQDVYRDVAERARSAAAPVADVLLLAACQDNQTASDGRPDPTGHQNGAFTRALRGVWQSALDYADLHSKIVAQLPSTQSPNLYWATDPDLGFQRQPPFRI